MKITKLHTHFAADENCLNKGVRWVKLSQFIMFLLSDEQNSKFFPKNICPQKPNS